MSDDGAPYPDSEREFGMKVRDARKRLGISQEELAGRMKRFGYAWHQTMITKVEGGGRPIRLSEALDLSDMLGISLGDRPASRAPELALAIWRAIEEMEDSVRKLRKAAQP